MKPALAQFSDPEAASPYGGVAVTVGELASGLPGPPPSGPGICPGPTSPNCVLTGQYNRGRQGVNIYEPTLAGYGSGVPSKFTNINYYALDSLDEDSSLAAYNPIMAQPLWISNVPINGSTTSTWNVLVAATLNDSVYAFAADGSTSGTAAGTKLWKLNSSAGATGSPLYLNCGSLGSAVTPSASGPVSTALPYYGIVSTPVIDTVTTNPVIYTVSGCTSLANGIQWYLNAIDATTGGQLMTGTLGGAGGVQVTATRFSSTNQLQRPALLLTHTSVGGHLQTYIYLSFGTAVYEIGSGTQGFNGYVFGYKISYASSLPSGVSASALTGSPFSTTPDITLTGVYPRVSSSAIGSGSAATGPYANPSCGSSDPNKETCYHGDNWADATNVTGHGGGVWMAGKGPSSDGAGNVYFGAGNGTFDCSTTGTTCTSVSGMLNYAESAVELTSATVTPVDFYAPYAPTFLNDKDGSFPTGHAATPTKAQALNRYDLDFGTSGVLLFSTSLGTGTQTWAATADKTGYLYAMPTLNSGTGSTGMGQFQTGDGGLTSGSFTTQAPFQLSRLPPLTGTSTTTCPYPGTSPTHFAGSDCDQIMELAYWNGGTHQYLFAWPDMETLIATEGTGTSGSPTNYTFSTTPIDPCTSGVFCTNFPQAFYPGGNMAVAANSTTSATLWISFINNATLTGEVRGYSITPGGSPFFTDIYDPTTQAINAGNCTGLPPLPASFIPPSFAEPTLVNGMVFAPVFKAKTSSGTVISGGGVMVYGTCS